VAGARRTAEELGHAFPGTPVVMSGGTATLPSVPATPVLVVATPGAEPPANGGYAAAVLLDGWALLARPSLDASQEALRRWLNAASLVVPGAAGGRVVVVADAGLPAVQALIRWDPVTHAERELAERAEVGFPPAVRMAAVTGPAGAVGRLLTGAVLPASAEVLGPIELGGAPAPPAAGEPESDQLTEGSGGRASPAAAVTDETTGVPGASSQPVRVLLRVPKSEALALASALQQAQAGRSARKDPGQVRVQVDPAELI
jgi:primosomal protein N' (replication factor Y) (superfamily II helicase)